ncbi:MAG: type I restriction enzyme HsdR N-terminal domain-containing protein [Alistipes sp.]|nr:type I restriction enzyme HsdR N-terminal domain-containing protein [Alistipes sp.]
MSALPKLIFPSLNLRQRESAKGRQIWCETRRQWLMLTPEEWVRRHLVGYLVQQCGVAPLSIVEEYPVPLNGQPQRADVVVVDGEGKPFWVAECKAPEIELDDSVLEQAMRYNAVLKARYVLITNGLKLFCFELTADGYRQLAQLPRL